MKRQERQLFGQTKPQQMIIFGILFWCEILMSTHVYLHHLTNFSLGLNSIKPPSLNYRKLKSCFCNGVRRGTGTGLQDIHLQNIWGPLNLSPLQNRRKERKTEKIEKSVTGHPATRNKHPPSYPPYWETRA